MREYAKKPESQSRTLNSNPIASKQALIADILQTYKEGTLGRQPVQRESVEDEEILQAKTLEQAPDVCLATGQVQHIPLEAKSIIQQKQGYVQPALPVPNFTVGSDNKTIQRYLIVGSHDLTRWYKERWDSYAGDSQQDAKTATFLNDLITNIAVQMINELNGIDPVEHQMIEDIETDAGGLLRSQITKWIEEKPGTGIGTRKSHPVFGRKSQTRAYENFKELAYALLGWVKAKHRRSQEKVLAVRVQTGDAKDAIDYHLNSILMRIKEWISGQGTAVQIIAELNTPREVDRHNWNIYQNYFNVVGLGPDTTLPASYTDLLNNPQNYDVRQKTGMLHDLMHYFMEKYNIDNSINLVDNVVGLNATVADSTLMSGMRREVYDRPKNTQIRDDQKDDNGLVKPEAMPGSLAPDAKIEVSKEEQHGTYKLARSKSLPMYGRHSFTAVRMMRMVQQSGGTPTEISAMAWSIMAYWRMNYDHRNIPYHTLHEIMDFLPEFGGVYDVDNPYAGIDLFTEDGLIQSLRTSISTDPNARDIAKLIYTDTILNNAVWFLANSTLWTNAEIMRFLSTTILPDLNFFTLDKEDLRSFFTYNDHTQHLKTLIPENRRNYVDSF